MICMLEIWWMEWEMAMANWNSLMEEDTMRVIGKMIRWMELVFFVF